VASFSFMSLSLACRGVAEELTEPSWFCGESTRAQEITLIRR
jgi:hypothetical protein